MQADRLFHNPIIEKREENKTCSQFSISSKYSRNLLRNLVND